MSEGGFVAKQEAESRFNFGLEMFNVSLEGDFQTLGFQQGPETEIALAKC